MKRAPIINESDYKPSKSKAWRKGLRAGRFDFEASFYQEYPCIFTVAGVEYDGVMIPDVGRTGTYTIRIKGKRRKRKAKR